MPEENVCIVEARGGTGERILGRLAATLSKQTGWPVVKNADPTRDCNILLPYLELPSGGLSCPTVSWFTHKDVAVPAKVAIWDAAARLSTVRSASAQMYVDLLVPYGLTLKITPPIDFDIFKLGAYHRNGGKKLLGVSGFVYSSGRKGERMLAALSEAMGPKVEIVASGVGWPVRCLGYDWGQMPAYYRSLDALICTSIVEGIPMPPLEALACGVPVVVPQGVGMMGELDGLPGVYSYPVGDIGGLASACREALAYSPDREELRANVTRFTAEAWADGFRRAVDRAIRGPEAVVAVPGVRIPETMPAEPVVVDGRGIYVVAFGDPSRICAKKCISSVKRLMPEVPVALASDKPLGIEDVFLQLPDRDIGGRWAKLGADLHTPEEWRHVVYLDADIELVAPIYPIFQFLEDGWDFVICKDMDRFGLMQKGLARYNENEKKATLEYTHSDMVLLYNGGLFGFRRGMRTTKFFNCWRAEYDRWCERDQGALVRALYTVPLRMYVLGNLWNCSDRYPHAGQAAVLHHNVSARRWNEQLNARLDSKAAWDAVHRWNGKQDP